MTYIKIPNREELIKKSYLCECGWHTKKFNGIFDEIEQFYNAEIKKLKNPWIKCSERLPEDEHVCLIIFKNCKVGLGDFSRSYNPKYDHKWISPFNHLPYEESPIYWQPIVPPEEL